MAKLKTEQDFDARSNQLRNLINDLHFAAANSENPAEIKDAEEAIPILETELKLVYEEKYRRFPVKPSTPPHHHDPPKPW